MYSWQWWKRSHHDLNHRAGGNESRLIVYRLTVRIRLCIVIVCQYNPRRWALTLAQRDSASSALACLPHVNRKGTSHTVVFRWSLASLLLFTSVCYTYGAIGHLITFQEKEKNMIKVTEQNDIATSIRLFIKSLIGCDVIPPGATPWILPCYCIDKQRFVISWWGGGWILHAKLEVLGICYLRPFQHNCMPSRI